MIGSAAPATPSPLHIGITALAFLLLGLVVIVGSCAALDRDLQREIEAMNDAIQTHLDPALPASFESAAKKQAQETVKYAETNDPLLRRNIREMVDTIRHDLDPALPDAERARLLAHAQAVQTWADTDERPAYFSQPAANTEPSNSP